MTSISTQPACLRCRSRKTKCLGRTEDTDCQSCLSVGVKCEVVPHQRGRKVGTRLSDSVRARLKRQRTKKKEERKSKRVNSRSTEETQSQTLNDEDNHDPTDDYNLDKNDNENQLNAFPLPSSSPETTLLQPQETSSYSASLKHIPPTSSIRITSQHPYPAPNERSADYTDIGPSIRRTSSIARIFSDVDKDKERNSTANRGLALWREDPMTCGYIDETTAKELFNLFMQKIAPNVYIFDETLHTYDWVQRTSSFLFCVIMATAAKFSPKISAYTHKKCLALAKDQILRVFADDVKSEQTVQAFRIAVDLDLSTPRPDYDERRNRDRQRIWLSLYAADKRFNYCGQTSKPSMMPEDNLVRNSESWVYSPICLSVDYRLASNVALRRVLSVSIEAIDKDSEAGPGNYALDLRSVYQTFEKDSEAWVKTQTERDPDIAIHANLTALHAKVIISHRWVQRSFRNYNPTGDAVIEENQERERREALAYCINGSLGCLATMCQLQDDLLRYTCDSKHLYFAYASFFLYKVFDTKIATTILDQQSLSYIFGLFQRSADKLESLALSPTHTIAFHAAFLRRLSRFDHSNEGSANLTQDTGVQVDPNNLGTRLPASQSTISNSSSAPGDPMNGTFTTADATLQPVVQAEIGDPAFDFSSFDPLPDLGNWLLENPIDESLGANINWNNWWPFDDSSWNFGVGDTVDNGNNGMNGTDDADWQGVVHTL
uniref:Zn(2)-C6 fungal-type domain-containing protein n=1 Tax=Kwoniella dejecticola CBS 10117 TaxID=1296121 RepID=A0A1A5ZWA1_9TREE|nr:uncharacterized protein I303_07999 [Kwoniella dejecticola CBS 10117]OBR82085.1 hypothetical protein I303_07999 [Kwoniella dejecticola CBS 10117]